MTKVVDCGAAAELFERAGIEPQGRLFGLSTCEQFMACESNAPYVLRSWVPDNRYFYNVFNMIKRWAPNIDEAILIKNIFKHTNGLNAYVSYDIAKELYMQIRAIVKRLGTAAFELFKYWTPLCGKILARDYFIKWTTTSVSTYCGVKTFRTRSFNPLCCPVAKTPNVESTLLESLIIRFLFKMRILRDEHLRNVSIIILKKKNLLYIPLIGKGLMFGTPSGTDFVFVDTHGEPTYRTTFGRYEAGENVLKLPMYMCKIFLNEKHGDMELNTTNKSGNISNGHFGPEIHIHSINGVRPKQVDLMISVPYFLGIVDGWYGETKLALCSTSGKRKNASKLTCKFEVAPIGKYFN